MSRFVASLFVAAALAALGFTWLLARDEDVSAGSGVDGFPPGFSLAIDCDPSTPDVDGACTVFLGASQVDAAVVFINNSGAPTTMGAFNFMVLDNDTSRLSPVDSSVPGNDGNPDFNDEITGSFVCGPVWSHQSGASPGTARSSISCPSAFDGPTLNAGSITKLATVHYQLPVGATVGAVSLSLRESQVARNESLPVIGNEIASCNPPVAREFDACLGAAITLANPPAGSTPTPTFTTTPSPTATHPPATAITSTDLDVTPFAAYIAIDCDLATTGVQDDCTFYTDAGALDVGVVFVNFGGVDAGLCCFNFAVRDADESRLAPPAIPSASTLDSNPDANQAVLASGFQCGPPAPRNRMNSSAPGEAISWISCFTGSPQDAPIIPTNGSVVLGWVHYDVPPAAEPGDVALSLLEVNVANSARFREIASCNPVVTLPGGCYGATVRLLEPPAPVGEGREGADGLTETATIAVTETAAVPAAAPIATSTNTPVSGSVSTATHDVGAIDALSFAGAPASSSAGEASAPTQPEPANGMVAGVEAIKPPDTGVGDDRRATDGFGLAFAGLVAGTAVCALAVVLLRRNSHSRTTAEPS